MSLPVPPSVSPSVDPSSAPRVRVWDLPTRLFHVALAVSVVGSVVTANIGGNAMAWHFRFGYLIFALLLFRLLWGFVGGRWSRFGQFLYHPVVVWRFVRGQSAPAGVHWDVGHSPLGALSVWALLVGLAVQVGTGLMADDDIANAGPWVQFVSSATSRLATGWHTNTGQYLVMGLVALHVAAILFYRWRGQNLVTAMITGDKHLPLSVPPSQDGPRHRLLAALLLAASAGVVAGLIGLGTA
ncbi:MAG: cytochrome b/b6 domain-containing protein [Pseudomonadota bacterium]